jgi:hypothetical protein
MTTYANANDYNEYYTVNFDHTGANPFGRLLTLNKSVMDGLHDGCDFKKYLEELKNKEMRIEPRDTVHTYDNPHHIVSSKNGYIMPDSWKHELIDTIVTETPIDDIETYIGELGIRKAFKLYEDMGIGDEHPNPATDGGLFLLFYGVLYQIIEIGEGVEEIDSEQYHNYNWGAGNPWDEEEDDEEDEEDEEEDEDQVAEEETGYGGVVAKAA